MSNTMKEAKAYLLEKFDGELYLNKEQTASALGIVSVTLDKYRNEGKIKGMARPWRIYFHINEIARFMCGE